MALGRKLPTEVQPGLLRHRITIAGPNPSTGGVDDIGGISQTSADFVAIRTCWASIDTLTGSKNLAVGQQLERTNKWITIRHPRTFVPDPSMQVWFQGRTFQINAVLNPTEQNKLLLLEVEELNQSISEAASPVPS